MGMHPPRLQMDLQMCPCHKLPSPGTGWRIPPALGVLEQQTAPDTRAVRAEYMAEVWLRYHRVGLDFGTAERRGDGRTPGFTRGTPKPTGLTEHRQQSGTAP